MAKNPMLPRLGLTRENKKLYISKSIVEWANPGVTYARCIYFRIEEGRVLLARRDYGGYKRASVIQRGDTGTEMYCLRRKHLYEYVRDLCGIESLGTLRGNLWTDMARTPCGEEILTMVPLGDLSEESMARVVDSWINTRGAHVDPEAASLYTRGTVTA